MMMMMMNFTVLISVKYGYKYPQIASESILKSKIQNVPGGHALNVTQAVHVQRLALNPPPHPPLSIDQCMRSAVL